MRVLVITLYPGPEQRSRSAVATYSRALCELLAGGADVTVCTDGDEGTEGGAGDRKPAVIRTKLTGLRGFLNALRVARTHRPDVIHVQHEMFLYGGISTILAFPFFLLGLRTVAPTVTTLHHVVAPNLTKTFQTIHSTTIPLWMIRAGLHALYRGIRASGTACVVHHRQFAEILTGIYGFPRRAVNVIAHGRNHDEDAVLSTAELRATFGIPDSARTVFGFFGFIDPRKKIDYMIDEFLVFAKTHPDCMLIVAGDIHPRFTDSPEFLAHLDGLRSLAAQHPNSFRWHGPVAENQISHFFQLCDCIILPYGESAGMSSVLADVIGAEKPSIVSESLRPFVDEADGIFAIREGALRECLESFMHRNLHAETAELSRLLRSKESLSWEESADRTLRLYGLVSDRSRTHRDVFLVGAYGQGNVGDELLLSVCLKELGKERCTVLTSDPSGTALNHRVHTIDRASRASIARAIAGSRAVVVGGGDQMKLLKRSTGRKPLSLLIQAWLLSAAAAFLRKPLYFVGIGIGNVSTKAATRLARATISRATFTTLREAPSYEWCLREVPSARFELASDLAFMQPATARSSDSTKRIAVAPAYQLDRPEAYVRLLDGVAHAADVLLRSDAALTFDFLPFQNDGSAHDDVAVCRDIRRRVQTTERCDIRIDFDTDTVENIYAQVDCVWGVRLHSLIVAASRGIPFIALVYDEKVRHFLREIGCEEWGIELDERFTAESLLALHERLMQHAPRVRAHLTEQAAKLREKTEVNRRVFERIRTSIAHD